MDLLLLAERFGLEVVLDSQDGLIRRDQAIAAGLASVRIDDLLRRSRWTRVLPGVYLAGAEPAAARPADPRRLSSAATPASVVEIRSFE